MSTYNGHKNRAYWNVALWIGNDEWLYRIARGYKRRLGARAGARAFVTEMAALGFAETPDGERYTVNNVTAALRDL